MLLKVCGNNHLEKLIKLEQMAPIDLLGFIFYPPSPRNISIALPKNKVHKRVGVFVNEQLSAIQALIESAQLDYVQLHGDEDPEFCKLVHQIKPVIKVFRIDSAFNFDHLKAFESCCDYFLFDTKSPSFGGSGEQFDWTILNHYHSAKPFFLSGGIKLSDLEKIIQHRHPHCVGIDINSGFELAPGIKDENLIDECIKKIRQ